MNKPLQALLMVLAAAFSCPVAAAAAAAAERPKPASIMTLAAQTATHLCIDILSRAVALPGDPTAEQALLARYGLEQFVPPAAMEALGPGGQQLLAQAMLASAAADDGDLVVAIGGKLGDSCRIILWRAPADPAKAGEAALTMPDAAWFALPPGRQMPDMIRKGFFRRDAKGAPFLANILAPEATNTTVAFKLLLIVAPIPANVATPPGK